MSCVLVPLHWVPSASPANRLQLHQKPPSLLLETPYKAAASYATLMQLLCNLCFVYAECALLFHENT